MIYSILSSSSSKPQSLFLLATKQDAHLRKCFGTLFSRQLSSLPILQSTTNAKLNSSFLSPQILILSNINRNQNLTFLNKNITINSYKLLYTTSSSSFSSSSQEQKGEGKEEGDTSNKQKKPQSKFKQFYSQYGPIFLVVHLTTVVMWIYGFFLISKQ